MVLCLLGSHIHTVSQEPKRICKAQAFSTLPPSLTSLSLFHLAHQYIQHHPSWPSWPIFIWLWSILVWPIFIWLDFMVTCWIKEELTSVKEISAPKWSYCLKSISTWAVHVCAPGEEFRTPRKGEHGSSSHQKARLPTSCYFQTLQQLYLPLTSMKFSRLVCVKEAKCCCHSLLQFFLPFYSWSRQKFHTYAFLDFTQFLSAVLFQTLFLSCAFSAHCFSNNRAVQVSWLVPSLSNSKKSPVQSHDLSTSFSVCRFELITLGQKIFDMLLWSPYPIPWIWSPTFSDCASVRTSENTVEW